MNLVYTPLIILSLFLTSCATNLDSNCNLLYSNFNKKTEFNNIKNIGVYRFDIKESLSVNETYNIELEFENMIENPNLVDENIKITIIALISDFKDENKFTNNINSNTLIWKFSTDAGPYFNTNSKNYIKSSFTISDKLNLNNLNLTIIAAYGKNIILSNENVSKWVLLNDIPKLKFHKINLQNINCNNNQVYAESYGEIEDAKN